MIRQTGGAALGETSTRSRPCSSAACSAAPNSMIPSCPPSSSMTRTSLARIDSLILVVSLLMTHLLMVQFTLFVYETNKIRRLHRFQVLTGAMPCGDSAGGHFLIADHQHIRNFFHLGFTNLETQFFIAQISLHTNPFGAQFFTNLLDVSGLAVSHIKDFNLNRGNPEWEIAGVMFDQNTDKTFNGPQDNPVDHDRPVLLAVTPDIAEIKPFREGKIALDCSTLPLPVKSVFELDIDLRAV